MTKPQRSWLKGHLQNREKILTFDLASQSSVKHLSKFIQEIEIFKYHRNVTIGGEILGLYSHMFDSYGFSDGMFAASLI